MVRSNHFYPIPAKIVDTQGVKSQMLSLHTHNSQQGSTAAGILFEPVMRATDSDSYMSWFMINVAFDQYTKIYFTVFWQVWPHTVD